MHQFSDVIGLVCLPFVPRGDCQAVYLSHAPCTLVVINNSIQLSLVSQN